MIARTVSRRDFLRARLVRPLVAHTHFEEAPASTATSAASAELRAQLLLANCLSQAYQTCTVCVERCGPQNAIALRSGLPILDETRCTGCGACAEACPSPRPAIRMVPRPRGARP